MIMTMNAIGFTFQLRYRHNYKRNHDQKKMMDYFLMIIITSIISVLMIVFFGVLSDINVLMTMIMVVMSPEGTRPQPTKTHARLYPFGKPIKSLYFRSFAFFVLFARFHFKIIRKSLYKNI